MAVHKTLILLFTYCFLIIHASHHWIVTDSGRIQSQDESSAFPVRRPYDLLALLEQEDRVNAIIELYKQLILQKKSIDSQWLQIEGEGTMEKVTYATDPDCIRGSVPLLQHDLNTDFIDSSQGSRPKMKTGQIASVPDCRDHFNLDFSMTTFPHLPVLNKRDNFNLTVNPVPSKIKLNYDVDDMLMKDPSDWTAYNVASYYWRSLGNGSNAIECSRRALYLSPRKERYIALLNLGTLLQQLGSHGESAIILHSAVDHDPSQYVSHMALGNIYAALGDYARALACYDNVLSLFPHHAKALQLKHAVNCHKKVESSLLGIHSSLQNILQDLQKYNEMQEKWLYLQNQVSWERDGKNKDDLFLHLSAADPLSINLEMVLQNVEDQAKTLNEEVSKKVFRKAAQQNSIVTKVLMKNQLKTESVFDCSVESCPGYINPDEHKKVPDNENCMLSTVKTAKALDAIRESSEKEMLLKVVGLMKLMKTMRDNPTINVNDFKQKISQQIDYFKSLDDNERFSKDQTWFLNNFEACTTSHHDSLPLTKCLMRILDKYMIDVGNRLMILKERIDLMNEMSAVNELTRDNLQKKSSSLNAFPDETTLENYVVEPNSPPQSLMFENLKESESCQRFRDTTEL